MLQAVSGAALPGSSGVVGMSPTAARAEAQTAIALQVGNRKLDRSEVSIATQAAADEAEARTVAAATAAREQETPA